MNLRTAATAIVGLALLGAPLRAQDKGGTLTGVVRDSSTQPIADVEIIARPGNHRTRTDSTGHFSMSGFDNGGYFVVARKVGYAQERWDVKLSKSGKVDIKFVMHRQAQLDTVVVTAKRECPPYTLEGFECHRRAGGGLFLDYPDIDEKGATLTGDLFRDIPGFRVALRSTRNGVVPVPETSNGFGCVNTLVDGRPVTISNPIPAYTQYLSAMEVYVNPDSVPPMYVRYVWPNGDVTRTGRCKLIVYWTTWAPLSR